MLMGLFLLGCRNREPQKDSAGATPVSPTSSGQIALDCDLLTRTEVASSVGEPESSITLSKDSFGCSWRGKASFVTLLIDTTDAQARYKATVRNEGEDLSNLADQAAWVESLSTLAALKRSTYLQVRVVVPARSSSTNREAAVELARLALAKV